jgi:acyl-CoA reductase-like NAD-dependent aldehyde dehydrogenase
VLTDTSPSMRVNCQEVFAPLVTLTSYREVEEAIAAIDDSDYGLQAGLFTRDMKLAFEAYERLEVGGLVVNEISAHRVDPMPYGGVKGSGLGREGIRWAMEEMTEEKLFLYNPNGF